MLSQLADQFGYDLLYVGNPNLGLYFSGNMYEGARAVGSIIKSTQTLDKKD